MKQLIIWAYWKFIMTDKEKLEYFELKSGVYHVVKKRKYK